MPAQPVFSMERMKSNERILLNHGSGGRLTRQLIDDVFGRHFANPLLDARTDASIVGFGGELVAFTTDSFVVQPRFFPGGDIGKLAVCGTVNDLAVSGARPQALSAAFIIEEGFSREELVKIVVSMAATAREAGVTIVTGDTKVVNRGMADGLFITTAGIGSVNPQWKALGCAAMVNPGDVVMVNGYLGDHGMAILAARNDLPIDATVQSDCAPLNGLIQDVLALGEGVTFMRDATRGGLGTVVCELAESCGRLITLDEAALPVRPVVSSLCALFGFDPLFIANEGKVVFTVRPSMAETVLAALKQHPLGRDAAVIGVVGEDRSGLVTGKTAIGGSRVVTVPAGDQLPRIC